MNSTHHSDRSEILADGKLRVPRPDAFPIGSAWRRADSAERTPIMSSINEMVIAEVAMAGSADAAAAAAADSSLASIPRTEAARSPWRAGFALAR